MTQKLKVLCLNMWGLPYPFSRNLNKRIKNIASFINKNDFDVICLQECWSKNQLRKLKKLIKNYYFSTSNKGIITNQSGLVTLTKIKPISNNLIYYKRPFATFRIDETIAGKGVLITQIKINKENFFILNTHNFSRSEDKHIQILFSQLNILKKVIEKYSSTIIAGELNINNKEFSSWNSGLLKFSFCSSPGLNPKNPYRKYTPLHFNKDGDTVSHIGVKTNPIKSKIKTKVLDDVFLSDHQPIVSEIEFY